MKTRTYSLKYWKLVADGYEKLGKAVPQDVLDGMAEAKEEATAVATEWMVVDDAGRELARIVNAESGNTPWRQEIRGASIQGMTIFGFGPSIVPSQMGPRFNIAMDYLSVKKDLDWLWGIYVDNHRHTAEYQRQIEFMFKHGRAHHHYPSEIDKQYCERRGWKWTPMMGIGTGTTVHLRPDELPQNALVKVTSVLLAVLDGKLYVPNQLYVDEDVTRGGTRAVYGWWTKEQ